MNTEFKSVMHNNYTVINSIGVIILRAKNVTREEAVKIASEKENVIVGVAKEIWTVIETSDEAMYKRAVADWKDTDGVN